MWYPRNYYRGCCGLGSPYYGYGVGPYYGGAYSYPYGYGGYGAYGYGYGGCGYGNPYGRF